MRGSLLANALGLVAFLTGCGNKLNGLKPFEFARPGQKSSLPQVIYEEKSINSRPVLSEFTLINIEKYSSGTFGRLANIDDAGTQPDAFNTIGVNPRASYEPTKHTRVTRSLRDIQDFNTSSSCATQLNDLAEIKSLYPRAILICDKQFAELINNASMITIDSESYTSWSRSTHEFLSARLLIHNF
jgi:hypothetical protein